MRRMASGELNSLEAIRGAGGEHNSDDRAESKRYLQAATLKALHAKTLPFVLRRPNVWHGPIHRQRQLRTLT